MRTPAHFAACVAAFLATCAVDLRAQSLGYWGPLKTVALGTWPSGLIAVHMVHLPGGTALIWGYPFMDQGIEKTQCQLYNSYTGQFIAEAAEGDHVAPADLFCAGHALDKLGNALILGGDGIPEQVPLGIRDVFEFNPTKRKFERKAYMQFGRWYPTATCLSDGRVLATLGYFHHDDFEDRPEVFQPTTNLWTTLAETPGALLTNYPFLFTIHDPTEPSATKLFYAGKYRRDALNWQSGILTVPATGSTSLWTNVGQNTFQVRGSGAVMLINGTDPGLGPIDRGVIYKFGGGSAANPDVATNLGDKFDLNASPLQWVPAASMIQAREDCNLVLLPDGRICAIGGFSVPGPSGTVWNAEIFNPEAGPTGTWYGPSPDMAAPRRYHSSGGLLPDGSVLMGGTDGEYNAQIYYPDYFQLDVVRPVITGTTPATTMGYDSTLEIASPHAPSVEKVTLLRLGATTHGFDQNQRYIRMTVLSQTATTITVRTPKNSGIAPPGDYMLFLIAGQMPSMAKYMRIQ